MTIKLDPKPQDEIKTSGQSNTQPKPGDWQLEIGGVPFMWGDASIRIIFFNLNGRNFLAPEPWRQQTHPEYMEYMANVYPGCFVSGQTLKLVDPSGSVAGEHTF